LSDLSVVYAGYFVSLSDQSELADAFRVIERARGRVEAQALAHHEVVPPHEPNPAEQHLTRLNVELLDTDEEPAREHILDAICSTEQQLDTGSRADEARPTPVSLGQLQHDLRTSEIVVEYVLANPHSYALAVTQSNVRRYTLPSKDTLEHKVSQYRAELMQQKTDQSGGQQLFDWLLGDIPEFKEKHALIVVPDGSLHLLPFSALMNQGHYVLTSHLVTVSPSGTVLHILRHRAAKVNRDDLPYVGVAAWTSKPPTTTLLASIRRAVTGPSKRELVNTMSSILRFTDMLIPSTALVFAPEQPHTADGLLQVRETRDLRFNASLVTLSACNTGVGPVGEEGAANIVNAFIEAGAQSVVSTLWELEDHATAHFMTDF
jgi:CHAT domain-containing protein